MGDKILIRLTDLPSHIENEVYFPLRVVYNTATYDVRHAGFYKGSTDLLELAIAGDPGVIKYILLTICHHYSISDSCFDYSSIVPSDDEVILRLTDHNKCSVFHMDVYNNCAVIRLTKTGPSRYIKCGQVLFGIDGTNNICLLIVTDLTDDNIRHTVNELEI